jgi:signal peptidase I
VRSVSGRHGVRCDRHRRLVHRYRIDRQRHAAQAVGVAALVLLVLTAYGTIDNQWYRVLAVQGNSMSPTLTTGDAIVITRPPENIEPGSIVTLQIDGQIVTHRYIGETPDGVPITRGDANENDDDWTNTSVTIVCVHRIHVPFLGTLMQRLGAVRSSEAWFTAGAWTGDTTMTAGAEPG